MSDVFISWSSADNAIVHPLRDALKNSRYSVEEYSVDPAGGNISVNVRRYVDEARLVIFVFSPTSAGQPWIQTEVDWVYYRRVKEQFPEVIPLLVGGVDEDSLPQLVRKDPLLTKAAQLKGHLRRELHGNERALRPGRQPYVGRVRGSACSNPRKRQPR